MSILNNICLTCFTVVVVLISLLITRPEVILPQKIYAAVSLKGWDGFSELIVANIAQRTKGQRRTKSREAWYHLLESLRDIDVQYLSPESDVVTEEEIAQGHEYFLHLLAIGLDSYVINADVTRPKFKNVFNPDRKWLVDQPDAIYLTATISTDFEYVIEGVRQQEEVYFSYTVYTHTRGGGWASNVVSETAYPRSSQSGRHVVPDERGHYRIIVSSSPPAVLQENEQWLQIPDKGTRGPAEVSIISRHYFEGEVSIQMQRKNGSYRVKPDVDTEIFVVEPPDSHRSPFPSYPSDESVAERINFLSNFLVDHTIVYAPGGKATKDSNHQIPDWYSIKNNIIGKPGLFIGSSSGVGAPDVHYAAGPWKLAPQEALIIEGIFPSSDECVFANVILQNKFLQSLDYQHGRSQHFNRRQVKNLGDNGSYRFVLAHEDPGMEFNWLDTEGRETGIIFYRYMLNSVDVDAPKTKVINFNELNTL